MNSSSRDHTPQKYTTTAQNNLNVFLVLDKTNNSAKII